MRARLLWMLLAAPLAAQEKPVGPVELEAIVAALDSTSTARRHAVEKLLALQDPKAIEAIESALPKFRNEGQVAAVKLLRQLPEGQARPALRRLLAAKAPHLRLCAGLALHGTSEPGVLEAMSGALDAPDLKRDDYRAMSSRLTDFDAFRQGGAAEALIRPERNEEFLLWFFTAPDIRAAPDAIRAAAVIAESDKRALPRALAAAYLVRHRKSDYTAVLGEALATAEFRADRFAAVRTILNTRVGDRPSKPPEIAAKVIAVAAAKQNNGELIRRMLLYLRALDFPRLRPLCLKLIEHPSDTAATTAFAMLASLKVRPPDDALRRVIEKGPDAAALEAASLLLRADDSAGFGRILRCARENKTLRGKAINLLGEFGKPQAMDFLIAALDDDQPAVREAAYDAVALTLERLYPYRRFRWPRALTDARADPAQRKAAVGKIRVWWEKNRDADW